MKEFLYLFGYEDPIDVQVNEQFGTDQECCAYVRIIAVNETDALIWGQEISQNFISEIFQREGKSFDWKSTGYVFKIEKNPDNYTLENFHNIPIVKYGEYPDTDKVLQPFDD